MYTNRCKAWALLQRFKDLMGEGRRGFIENRMCAGYNPVKALGCDVARLMKGLHLVPSSAQHKGQSSVWLASQHALMLKEGPEVNTLRHGASFRARAWAKETVQQQSNKGC